MNRTSEELADRVHSLAIRLLRQARDTESDLSAARLSALTSLIHNGPMTVGELAATEQVTAPTMSRLVTGLERQGYVKRRSDIDDGRRVRVSVEPAGVRAMEETRRHRVSRMAAALGDLSEARQATVIDAVEALESALDSAPGLSEAHE